MGLVSTVKKDVRFQRTTNGNRTTRTNKKETDRQAVNYGKLVKRLIDSVCRRHKIIFKEKEKKAAVVVLKKFYPILD